MIDLVARVYENSRVLITGHTGFKGGWLSLWARLLGAEVIGYALAPPSQPNLFEAIGLADDIFHIHGDVRDLKHVQEVMARHQPAFVFHLAAQPLVRLSYREPHLTYETNLMGTVNVLEAIRQTESVRAAVIITSDKCYENQGWIWGYRENDPMGGSDPYSSSKGAAELIVSAYLRSYFSPQDFRQNHHISLASVRAGNVIGGGDWGMDRLIPDCIRAISQQKPLIIRNPTASRPWQHVLDPLFGYLLLGAKLWGEGVRYASAWNFGPLDEDPWLVETVVQKVVKLWGSGSYRIEEHGHPPEAHWLRLDCSKARLELGWRPQYSLEQALHQTVAWYKQYYNGVTPKKLKAYTVKQIREYMDLTK